MAAINELFTEIFRPKEFANMVLLDRIKKEVSAGLTQNVILYGPQGTGKTTIARILTKGYQVLALNGSKENGIDIIRDRITRFCGQMSLEFGSDKVKVVYIDECDGFTDKAWDAMRETIEHYASSARFVCTCNRIDKVPAPIRSRFNCIPVYPINKEESEVLFEGYKGYVGYILNGLKISYTDAALTAFIRNSFPDMRSIFNTIQSLHTQRATELNESSLVKTFECTDLFEQILNVDDPIENWKFVNANYATSASDALLALSKKFVDYWKTAGTVQVNKIPAVMITIVDYLAMLPNSVDPQGVLLACIYKLQMIIKKQA